MIVKLRPINSKVSPEFEAQRDAIVTAIRDVMVVMAVKELSTGLPHQSTYWVPPDPSFRLFNGAGHSKLHNDAVRACSMLLRMYLVDSITLEDSDIEEFKLKMPIVIPMNLEDNNGHN